MLCALVRFSIPLSPLRFLSTSSPLYPLPSRYFYRSPSCTQGAAGIEHWLDSIARSRRAKQISAMPGRIVQILGACDILRLCTLRVMTRDLLRRRHYCDPFRSTVTKGLSSTNARRLSSYRVASTLVSLLSLSRAPTIPPAHPVAMSNYTAAPSVSPDLARASTCETLLAEIDDCICSNKSSTLRPLRKT